MTPTRKPARTRPRNVRTREFTPTRNAGYSTLMLVLIVLGIIAVAIFIYKNVSVN